MIDLARLAERVWYGRDPRYRWLAPVLMPLGWAYCGVALLRADAYRRGWLGAEDAGVPVIVVGNLSVGGTGKTPLTLWLADYLRARGQRPGIVLRGHGGSAHGPALVPADGDAAVYGDEAVLLARRAGCPVAIGRDRVAAARLLVGQGCDLVVSDDGLQHYRLRRALEIAVIDGIRRLGNGRCLPAGPLREPPGRLRRVDLVILNGGDDCDRPGLNLLPRDAVSLLDPAETRPLADFAGEPVTAVAGIGNPERFFAMLRGLGLTIDARAYPDHHRFSAADVASWPPGSVLMTEKDAVKLRGLARPGLWLVPVDARPEARFVTALGRALVRVLAADANADADANANADAGASPASGDPI